MSLNSLECQQNRGGVYGWRRRLPSLSTLSPNPVKCFFRIAGVAFTCEKEVINDVQISFEDLMGGVVGCGSNVESGSQSLTQAGHI